jgi:hypothetical protein
MAFERSIVEKAENLGSQLLRHRFAVRDHCPRRLANAGEVISEAFRDRPEVSEIG